MQTNFSLAQLADPKTADINDILRTCVHCGFCTATCPTYVTLGDELDSPRGRIYLMKGMFEGDEAATPEVAKHLDRCLSCLACMTTCPSGVDYMHLIDYGREHVHETYQRPTLDRLTRTMLNTVLPYPTRFRAMLFGAKLAKPFKGVFPKRFRHMLDLAPPDLPPPSRVDRPQVFAAEGARIKRVALLQGCAQQVIEPEINEATIRLLTRHGVEVVVARGAGCCGALTHHMGRTHEAEAFVKRNIDAWTHEIDGEGLDAVVINASGCGTTVKDYGWMLKRDPDYADKAARIAALAKDVTEIMSEIGLQAPVIETGHAVAYHSACSMQHGQQILTPPKKLLQAAGFTVKEPAEAHLCCGSAGTYNLTQPEIAGKLKARKVGNLERIKPEIIATGNIGCLTQIASGTDVPVVHTASLLDWVTGGPLPKRMDYAKDDARHGRFAARPKPRAPALGEPSAAV